jgi:hypothetical protein
MKSRISYREFKNPQDFGFSDVPRSYDKTTKTIEIKSGLEDIIQAYCNMHPEAEDVGQIIAPLSAKALTVEQCRAAAKAQANNPNPRLEKMAAQLQKCIEKYDEINK